MAGETGNTVLNDSVYNIAQVAVPLWYFLCCEDFAQNGDALFKVNSPLFFHVNDVEGCQARYFGGA
jgi:hypothetical protein